MTPKSLIGSALDRSWSNNLNRSNTWEKQEKQTTSHKEDKQTNVARRRRNHKIENEIDVKITYFNKKKIEKRVRGVILVSIAYSTHLFNLFDSCQSTHVNLHHRPCQSTHHPFDSCGNNSFTVAKMRRQGWWVDWHGRWWRRYLLLGRKSNWVE